MTVYEFEGKRPLIGKGSYVHPQAVLIGDVEIGQGCFVGAGAVLRGDFGRILVGDGSNVQENSVLHASPLRPVDIKDDVIVAHGVLMHDATVMRGSVIGMGSILLHNAIVEEEAMVGAGAVVAQGFVVPSRRLVQGNPAEVSKKLSDKFIETARLGLLAYQELPRRYLDGARRLD